MKVSLRITFVLVVTLAFASNTNVVRAADVATNTSGQGSRGLALTDVARAAPAATYDVPDADTSDLEADDHSSPWSGDNVHEEDGQLEPGKEIDEDEESSEEGAYDRTVLHDSELVTTVKPQALTVTVGTVAGRNLRTV